MAERTEHFGLTLWGKEDEFQSPAGLNGNFAALDGAVAGLVVTGSYAGDGATNRTIELGFAPRAVLVENKWGVRANQTGYGYSGLALKGAGLNDTTITLTDSGFALYYNGSYHNANRGGYTYYYVAFQ